MRIDFAQPLALYGGSFDPVHQGHIEVVRALRRSLPEYQIVLVPSGSSPGKPPPLASAELRLKWLNLMGPKEGFLIWEAELKRPAPSYTVETLEEAHRLGARKESLFWVVGADAYNNLPNWKDPQKIRSLARIATLKRPGSPLNITEAGDLLIPITEHPASSSAIRAGFGLNPPLVSGLPEEVKSDLEGLTKLARNPYVRKD